MTYSRFEDLPVWKEAIRLADGIYNLTEKHRKICSYSLRDQSNLKLLAESCSRQLRSWAEHLQNSDIKDQRHLNENTRKRYQTNKDADSFQRELVQKLPPDHPLRKRKR